MLCRCNPEDLAGKYLYQIKVVENLDTKSYKGNRLVIVELVGLEPFYYLYDYTNSNKVLTFKELVKSDSQMLSSHFLIEKCEIKQNSKKNLTYFTIFFDQSFIMCLINEDSREGTCLALGKEIGSNVN